jgi:hypothetical protein
VRGDPARQAERQRGSSGPSPGPGRRPASARRRRRSALAEDDASACRRPNSTRTASPARGRPASGTVRVRPCAAAAGGVDRHLDEPRRVAVRLAAGSVDGSARLGSEVRRPRLDSDRAVGCGVLVAMIWSIRSAVRSTCRSRWRRRSRSRPGGRARCAALRWRSSSSSAVSVARERSRSNSVLERRRDRGRSGAPRDLLLDDLGALDVDLEDRRRGRASASRTWSRGEPYQLPWTSFASRNSRRPRCARNSSRSRSGSRRRRPRRSAARASCRSRRSSGRRRPSRARALSASMIVSLPTPDGPEMMTSIAPGRRRRRSPAGRSAEMSKLVGHRRPPVALARSRRGPLELPGSGAVARIRCRRRRGELEPPGVEEQAGRGRPGPRARRARAVDGSPATDGRSRRDGPGSGGSGRSRGRARAASSREPLADAVAGRDAGRPATTAIRVRCFGSRPIGASIRPTAAATLPTTSARYVFLTRRALSWAISDAARRRAGDHQQAARVAVEAVDDARPRTPAMPPTARPAAGQQRVDERVVAWPGAGWTTRPAGLSTISRSSSS